jgi:hypothetical protein
MNRRDEHRENMSSPHSYNDGQWSPPPRFQEHDQIHQAQGSPQTYSPHPNSPPQVSPPLHEFQEEYQHSPQSQIQPHAVYQEGYVISI